MSYPLIPVFLKEVLRANLGFIGIVEAIAESTASIIRVFSGYLSDYLKKRKLLATIGYSLSTAGKPFLALATLGWHVLGVRFIDRLGKGIRTAPRDALIADSADNRTLGRAFGFHRAADTLGAVLGPLIAFLLLSLANSNYRLVFLLAFVPGLIAVFIILFLVREITPTPSAISNISRPKFQLSLKPFEKKFKILILIMIIFTLGNSSDAFLILRASDLGVQFTLIPLLWLSFNIAYFLSSYPGGVLSDKIGRKKTIVTGFFIYAGVYVALALARHEICAWLLFIVYGLYYGLTEGIIKAFIADLIPSDKRASAYGVYATAVGITLLPANLLMGFLWHFLGFQFAFFFGSAMALIASTLLLILL